MAFNLQTFKTRALSAIAFVIVMAAGLFYSGWSFFILFSFIHFGCWYEYQKLVEKIDEGYKARNAFHKYGVMFTGWFFIVACCSFSMMIGNFQLSVIGFWLLLISAILLPVVETLFAKHINLKNVAYSFGGLVYLSLSLGLLIDLTLTDKYFPIAVAAIKNQPYFEVAQPPFWLLPFFIILCMWVNDTMAYIVGSLIGKTPFNKISPKKTWEGTIGGAVLCVVVMGFAAQYFTKDLNIHFKNYHWFVMAAVAAVAGTYGDLLESKLKRLARVKDSGNIMPGHGGFLDRFDSLLIATPFVWLYIYLFIR